MKYNHSLTIFAISAWHISRAVTVANVMLLHSFYYKKYVNYIVRELHRF